MEFFEVIEKRHCCRKYDPTKNVETSDIEKIIDAGKCAPSAGGIYPVEFKIIKEQKLKEDLAEVSPGGINFIAKAPVILVVWADVEKTATKYEDRGRNLYVIQDAAAAAENIFLATVALGLSTCWIGAFDENKVQKILGLKNSQRPMVIMPIGYPAP